jgi:membrane protein YdbS with pleckstrin-like domain
MADDEAVEPSTTPGNGDEQIVPGDEETVSGDNATTAGDEETAPGDVAVHTTGERTLSSRVRIQWAVRLLVGVAVLAVLARVALARVGVDPLLAVAAAVGLAVLGLLQVHLRYRAWSYHLRADALYLERGVLTRVRTVAPHVRIQHVDTSRSPVERSLGLSTLVVYTAGSRGADVSIPGLAPAEASDLQRRLKKLAIETEGGDAL